MGLWARLFGEGHASRDLLADLAGAYRAEVAQAAHLRSQAERARYPQAAATLRHLADTEERHAGWLRDRITTLGGTVPYVDAGASVGTNQWERVVAAQHTARQKRQLLLEQINHWDPELPDIVDLLRRIEQEDQRAITVYDQLIMRSDPQSID